MAEIEEVLVAYILAQSGITGLIDRRLYPEEIPQGTTLPAVVYIKVSDVKLHTLTQQNKLEQPTFQFTALSFSKAEGRSIVNQFKTALIDFVGTMGGIVIQKIELVFEDSTLETNNYTDPITTVYVDSLEFRVNFEKA
jgi:hypothetical protein